MKGEAMDIYVIIGDCCGEYISAWVTEERANEKCRKMNAEYMRKYGRENYEVVVTSLNA